MRAVGDLLDSEIREICDGDLVDCKNGDYSVVHESEWVDQGKYSYKEFIFKLDGKYYCADVSRCGSYFSHYEYTYPSSKDIYEVREVEKTIKVWEKI